MQPFKYKEMVLGIGDSNYSAQEILDMSDERFADVYSQYEREVTVAIEALQGKPCQELER